MTRCIVHADKIAEPHVRGCPDCQHLTFGYDDVYDDPRINDIDVERSPAAQAFLDSLPRLDID